MDRHESEVETIEVDLLLEAVWRRYGYDFRAYARATIERRIRQFITRHGFVAVSELIPKVLREPEFFAQLARHFSIPVTELFRDPIAYQAVRNKVLPLLSTWPHIKIWHAGCASGEEAYSMAIVLKEAGLYERATLYATDFNDEALDRARAGIFEIEKIQEATRNYQQSGGTGAFSEYYHAAYNAVAMESSLRQRIVFSNHNLISDGIFGDMHLVFCRNVLIYFNRDLQSRVIGMLTESLVSGGFLCLGTKEDLQFFSEFERYEVIDRKAQIYRKRASS
jgi:chemotaxis protein methyltransferase CheR